MVMGVENEKVELVAGSEPESDRDFLNQVIGILLEECQRSINDHQDAHVFANEYLLGVDKNSVERLKELRALLEDDQRKIESGQIEQVDLGLLVNLLTMLERKFERGYQHSIDRLKKIQEELPVSH
jgi:hypothetical protein